MGSALIEGFQQAQVIPPDQIIAFDVDQKRLQEISQKTGIRIASSLSELIGKSKSLLLCLKPQQMAPCLKQCQPLSSSLLLISIAAGLRLSFYEHFFQENPIVRVMPNTPAQVRMGMCAFAVNSKVTKEQKAFVQTLLESVGKVLEVEEKLMDAVTALSGSGPGFVAYLVEALVDAGVLCGLSRKEAEVLTLQTVSGTIALIEKKKISPTALKAMVCSPAGTTIEGIKVMEKNGIKGAIMEAVQAACKRSSALSH